MQPIDFPEKNFTFGPPQGLTEEECGNLPCYKGKEGLWPVIISAWQPTPEELAEINKTGTIWLRVYSTGMFPISLSGHNPWPKEDASAGKEWILTQDQRTALREFIGTVFLMRDAQKAFDVVSSGSHLIKKMELEKHVDEILRIFVTDEVRQEWQKEKEEDNG